MTAIDVIGDFVGLPVSPMTPEGILLYASCLILVIMVFDEIMDIIHLVARSMFLK